MPETVVHPIAPVWDSRSAVLILGSMPSPRSREEGFYYAHPQNRFWPVMAALFGEELPRGTEERRRFALAHRIALWDVLRSCEIKGASDSSIRNPVPNDIRPILDGAPIRAVFTTGGTASRLYRRHIEPVCGRVAIPLPSTSAANCRTGLDALLSAYSVLLPYLAE